MFITSSSSSGDVNLLPSFGEKKNLIMVSIESLEN